MVLHSWSPRISLHCFHETRDCSISSMNMDQLFIVSYRLLPRSFLRSNRQHSVVHIRLPRSVSFYLIYSFFFFCVCLRQMCVFACAHVGNWSDIVVLNVFRRITPIRSHFIYLFFFWFFFKHNIFHAVGSDLITS